MLEEQGGGLTMADRQEARIVLKSPTPPDRQGSGVMAGSQAGGAKGLEQDTEEEGCDSLFSETEDEALSEDCIVTTPATPGCNPLHFPFQALGRRPHSAMGLQAEHADLTRAPLSPKPVRVPGKGRQRTFSTSATISTEREPIIRASRRTIYTAGRPPWYDSQGQQDRKSVV